MGQNVSFVTELSFAWDHFADTPLAGNTKKYRVWMVGRKIFPDAPIDWDAFVSPEY
jgi:hypothetical protein